MADRKDSRLARTRGEERHEGGLMPLGAGPLSMLDWMFDRLQRDFFGGPLSTGLGVGTPGRGRERLAHMSMRDADKELIVTVELPGIDPKDVHVECRDDILTIRGESREESGAGQGEDADRFVSHVQFSRQVQLPPDVDVDRAQASCKNGVLTLRFPKAEHAKNVKRIPITAEGGREASPGKERAA